MNQINDLIFKLYLYADTCKIIHYTCSRNHFHELADKIRESILDFVDDFAEQYYGYMGKPKKSELTIKHDVKEEDELSAICQDVLDMIEPVRKAFEKTSKFSNLVSLIDDFKGQLNQFKFLATFDRLSN